LGLALITASRESFYPLSEALLAWDADLHAGADDDGSMPLEIALQNRDIKLAHLLLAHGADPDRELVSGETCREMAKAEILDVFTKRFDGI
jgi:ankyrin repeat protein